MTSLASFFFQESFFSRGSRWIGGGGVGLCADDGAEEEGNAGCSEDCGGGVGLCDDREAAEGGTVVVSNDGGCGGCLCCSVYDGEGLFTATPFVVIPFCWGGLGCGCGTGRIEAL